MDKNGYANSLYRFVWPLKGGTLILPSPMFCIDRSINHNYKNNLFAAPKQSGRRPRKPGVERKPRQAYSAKQLERLEAEFKVSYH